MKYEEFERIYQEYYLKILTFIHKRVPDLYEAEELTGDVFLSFYRNIDVYKRQEFVEKNERGLKMKVSEGGTNFSGGQRQRLAIARAIVRRPSIYLFDDSFSALDYRTDQELRRALKPVTQNAAVIIVAQRISTIKDCLLYTSINKFKRHGSSAFHGILVSAGRAETAVASEWDKFKLAAMGTTVHGTAKRWITTVDHLIDIFHLSRSRMKCIFNFFIVVSKDSL